MITSGYAEDAGGICFGSILSGGLLLDVAIALLEAVYTTCGVHQLALTGIEWVRGV